MSNFGEFSVNKRNPCVPLLSLAVNADPMQVEIVERLLKLGIDPNTLIDKPAKDIQVGDKIFIKGNHFLDMDLTHDCFEAEILPSDNNNKGKVHYIGLKQECDEEVDLAEFPQHLFPMTRLLSAVLQRGNVQLAVIILVLYAKVVKSLRIRELPYVPYGTGMCFKCDVVLLDKGMGLFCNTNCLIGSGIRS